MNCVYLRVSGRRSNDIADLNAIKTGTTNIATNEPIWIYRYLQLAY